MKISASLLNELRDYYFKLKEADTTVEVKSAYRLSDSELEKISNQLSFIAKANIVNSVDEDILGGIIITYGTKRIDLSIKSQLETFKQIMYDSI